MGTWLVAWQPPVPGVPALVCLPQAGAGCGQYRAWNGSLVPYVAVLGVQLPGREERWGDPPAGQFDDVVSEVTAELVDLLAADTEVLIYGHSFGGLLGFEIARALGHGYGRWPRALVVAACRPPGMWVGAGRGLVDDEAELASLLAARGLGPAVLDPDSRAEMIELLRQDARLSMSYETRGDLALPCHLEAWGGSGDATVTPAQLDQWRRHAGGTFRRRDFPGGHTFHTAHAGAVLTALRELAGVPARPAATTG
jgi:surfactin synthase thioesterase subunit